MSSYPSQWNYLYSAFNQGRLPQALLFVGSFDRALTAFTIQLMRLIFCKNKDKQACGQCPDCSMVTHHEHPDVQWIKPEKTGGAIKIDQIRELQTYSYLTPQRARYRLIVIESADRLNTAAGNALLKILEEPAPHTLFLLIAQQLSTVLPTVLSRCQILRFSSAYDLSTMNLLGLGEDYPAESERGLLMQHAESILDNLITVIERKTHPCVVVSQWTQFELGALLWFFYLVYSQVQMMQINSSAVKGLAVIQLNKLASLLSPLMIFAQIDKINTVQRKLSHNMNINHTLVLEDLLFDLALH